MKSKILIIDDEVEICDMLSRHFRYIGYEVDTTTNPIEALDKLAENNFQVAILDIVMPKMSGIDLLRTIRKQYPMTHVVMITGCVTLDNALSCMRLGADTCIFKPLEDLTELEEAVANALKSLKHWQEKFKMLQLMGDAQREVI
ncbi:MAG: hypothetical protein A2Y10_12275 [Planctomycetes bacterium GWF2_41_51]|nr:MAG: hypothetical protein A2Y10_12275 [Planctomycetes bacterium GWF2_41_51]HBG28721.1 hypothetical protein [Phycisphaerales bacterium]